MRACGRVFPKTAEQFHAVARRDVTCAAQKMKQKDFHAACALPGWDFYASDLMLTLRLSQRLS